jgi:hypothetical protein
MELTERRNEKSLASHPAGTRTRPSEIRQNTWIENNGFVTETHTLHK